MDIRIRKQQTTDRDRAEAPADHAKPGSTMTGASRESGADASASDRIRQIESERDHAVAARQRALADFANFQRRSLENEGRARQQGVADIVKSVLPVLDHFDLALSQESAAAAKQFVSGMRMVRDELVKALQSHGVQRIEPAIGDEFQPGQHQAMMRQTAEGFAPNRVATVLQPGYAIGELVLRPAKVAVTPEAPEGP